MKSIVFIILFLCACTYTPPGNNHITQNELADGSVGTGEVINNDLTSDDLGTDSVDSDEIAADAVDSSEIATDAVGSSEISAGAVKASEIDTGAVGSDEIATNAVGNDEMIDSPSFTSINLSSGGAFKVKIFSTTITANGTVGVTHGLNVTKFRGLHCAIYNPLYTSQGIFQAPFASPGAINRCGTNVAGDKLEMAVFNYPGGTTQCYWVLTYVP